MDWLNLGGNLLGSVLGYQGQKDTNKANVQLGREQMEFQERMSSTAYQRAVMDMQKAGLNPMLAYSQGGASSPMGSMPQVQNAVAAGLSSARSTAETVYNMQQVETQKAQIEKIQAETAEIRARTQAPEMYQENWRQRNSSLFQGQSTSASAAALNRVRENLLGIDMDVKNTTYQDVVKRIKAEARLKELGIPEAEASAKFWRDEIGSLSPYIRQLLEVARTIFSGGSAMRGR